MPCKMRADRLGVLVLSLRAGHQPETATLNLVYSHTESLMICSMGRQLQLKCYVLLRCYSFPWFKWTPQILECFVCDLIMFFSGIKFRFSSFFCPALPPFLCQHPVFSVGL